MKELAVTENTASDIAKRFAVFRAREARTDVETTVLQFAPFSPWCRRVQQAGNAGRPR